MSSDFDLTDPDFFAAGVVGEPGARVFFLQARQQGSVVTLRLEKQQVSALAEYLGGMLENLAPPTGDVPGELELIEPAIEEWIVGSLAVKYEEGDDRFLVVAEELVLPNDDEGDDADAAASLSDAIAPASARFHLTREQVAGFVAHAAGLVAAGRPICPICAGPIDPDGHMCARSNGHRRR
ncbi:MAG: DUF3090 family protein [Actinobacteria bacterium]|nr:DUF3090 family protein [Actinomycetota bacterium]